MAADQERPVGPSGQREPLVAGGVDLLLDRDAVKPLPEPLARPLPGLRPRDPLRAVLVTCQLLELAEIVDGSAGLQRHAATLTW